MRSAISSIFALAIFAHLKFVAGSKINNLVRHSHPNFEELEQYASRSANLPEYTAEYWHKQARETVKNHKRQLINDNKAKNVIFFLGDGMSIPTLTASRIYLGQLEGKTGEENQLSFEKFPITGLSKTYCVNSQVADSACSSIAFLTGVKGNLGTLGVTAQVKIGNCEKSMDPKYQSHSILRLAMDKGKDTGFVTTARVTHATPGGSYAHSANRFWENDGIILKSGRDTKKCKDIADQLIFGDTGKQFKVILGCGRTNFLPNTTLDEEGEYGSRWDGINLIDQWKNNKAKDNKKHEYVWNKEQLINLDYRNMDYLLGLFEGDHCALNAYSDKTTEPTLTEMVDAAIKVLSKSNNGYVLFVEGGRIDHAHHSSLVHIALDETIQFSKAVQHAVDVTNINDTLIVVTADHSHTMSISGYPSRGSPILNRDEQIVADDGLPFTTISYANGPGYRSEVDGKRVDITNADTESLTFRFPGTVPLSSETHGGDDVAVFARGPQQHMFTGMYEQNTIPHLISYATCIDDEYSYCTQN